MVEVVTDSGLFLFTFEGVLIVFALGLDTEVEDGRDFLLVSTSEYFSGAYFRESDSFRPPDEVALALRDFLTRSRCLCSEKQKSEKLCENRKCSFLWKINIL